VVEPLLDNPRLLTATVAAVLGGTAIERPQLTGFLNSEFDPFLNQLFAAGSVTPREAGEALEGRPGFIWLADEPDPNEVGAAEAENLSLVRMHGMTATTAGPVAAPQVECEIAQVRSRSELRAWHEVYCEVFGGDAGAVKIGSRFTTRSVRLVIARCCSCWRGWMARLQQPALSTSTRTSPASTASRRASGCVVVDSHLRSCLPVTQPRKRAASSGRSCRRRHRAGRFTPEPGIGSTAPFRFS
jgi:hypothetical protein